MFENGSLNVCKNSDFSKILKLEYSELCLLISNTLDASVCLNQTCLVL